MVAKTGKLTVPTVMPVIFTYSGLLIVRSGSSRMYVDVAATLVSVRASVGVAPTGSAVMVDVLKNGVSIWNTPANRPQIAAGANTSGAVANFDTAAAAVGDYYTVDIIQVGSTSPGSMLTVQLRFANA